MSDQPVDPQSPIRGEPLNLEDLLALAEIDTEDIASALIFFDDNAPDNVKGTLE